MDETKLVKGTAVRRDYFGDGPVDKAMADRTDFNADFQDINTGFAWGEIWSRPGLDLKTKSCVTVAILVALNRPEQQATYMRAALRNGVSPIELRELLLHTIIYCGMPAAAGAFRVAQQILAEFEVAVEDQAG